nr:hemerythrin domain-containing protein [uncultured Rhodoferax sp.]
MFSWLKNLFVGESQSAGGAIHHRPAARPPAPPKFIAPAEAPPSQAITGRGLSFHADLIPKLLHEHRVVLELYGQILHNATVKDWGKVAPMLAQFKKGLSDHLLDEAVRLYVYLQKSVEDEESRALIRNFRTEMEGIGRVVIKVLDRFEDVAKSPYLQELFEAEWRGLGAVLGDRIAREEKTLYPLYA